MQMLYWPSAAMVLIAGCNGPHESVSSIAARQSAALQKLPAVRGITVNTVHGNERSIADTVRRFDPQVESMEGAGFMYACLIHEAPFAQVLPRTAFGGGADSSLRARVVLEDGRAVTLDRRVALC